MTDANRAITPTLLKQACAWRVRFNSGKVTPEQAMAFKEWCRQSPEHARAWQASAQAWQWISVGLENEQALQGAYDGHDQLVATQRSVRRQRRRFLVGGALSTGVLAGLAWYSPLDLWPAGDDYRADFFTRAGEQKHVQLEQGVSLELNTRTRISRIRHAENQSIEFLAGEAEILSLGSTLLVEVAQGQGQIRLDHAAMNLRIDRQQVSVTCLQGNIELQLAERHHLYQGQQLVYEKQQVLRRQPVALDEVRAWRTGVLNFVDCSLGQVIEEINRYRAGRVILRNAELAQRRVQLVVWLDDTEQAIAMISELYGADRLDLPGNIILLS